MAKKRVIVKNAIPAEKRKSGELYYVKDGDVIAVKANRKGGKKGRKVCRKK